VTYVAVQDDLIVGFVTVSPGSLEADDLQSGRRMPPYPLPILRIARLAVHADVRGLGLGKALLRFCLDLAERMKVELGCAGAIVDAKPGVEGFYEQYGFTPVSALEGKGHRVPAPTLMYLPLGFVPRSA
jgi:predicted N-acetyltransferase YhbS